MAQGKRVSMLGVGGGGGGDGGRDSPQQLHRTSPHMCVSLWHAPDSTHMMCYSL